jgi:Helix-turn-helix domain
MTRPDPAPYETRGSPPDDPDSATTARNHAAQPRMDPAGRGYGKGITTTDASSVARILGNVLRVVRESRFLSLRQVTVRSRGGFKPSSIASYERAERRLTVDRLFALADLYRVPPEQIIAEVSRRLREETNVDDDRRTG